MIIRRLNYGADLCEEIKRVCEEEKITSGWFNAVGALKKLSFGFYDQKKKKYGKIKFSKPCEIASCAGNISEIDGEVFVHAHICFADERGNVRGGHLFDSVIFACEAGIFSVAKKLKREYDKKTGLKLWK
ncbi:MAG: DNA-binding protein [Elusimicrobia bacterium CG08_land_8_20_14_0_20_44_26]|nr:MAG: DNA-binding protein [Elusimicrobia bacterium CG08_land_8_20_14_0_20_44_26]